MYYSLLLIINKVFFSYLHFKNKKNDNPNKMYLNIFKKRKYHFKKWSRLNEHIVNGWEHGVNHVILSTDFMKINLLNEWAMSDFDTFPPYNWSRNAEILADKTCIHLLNWSNHIWNNEKISFPHRVHLLSTQNKNNIYMEDWGVLG